MLPMLGNAWHVIFAQINQPIGLSDIPFLLKNLSKMHLTPNFQLCLGTPPEAIY